MESVICISFPVYLIPYDNNLIIEITSVEFRRSNSEEVYLISSHILNTMNIIIFTCEGMNICEIKCLILVFKVNMYFCLRRTRLVYANKKVTHILHCQPIRIWRTCSGCDIICLRSVFSDFSKPLINYFEISYLKRRQYRVYSML